MANVIDRRQESNKKFVSSRRRFMERNRRKIRKAIDKNIANSNIEDIGKDGVDVTVPRDGIKEPFIHHGKGGKNRRVLPGNKQFQKGDLIPRPPGGGGGGGGDPSNSGEGDDDFIFSLSEEEFLEILFEDMELPNLTKRSAQDTKVTQPKRAGFVNDGPENKIAWDRTKIGQLSRHFAFKKPHDRKILEALKEQRSLLLQYDPDHNEGDEVQRDNKLAQAPLAKKIRVIREEVSALREKVESNISPDDVVRIREGLEEDQTFVLARLQELDDDIEQREGKKKRVPKWNKDTDMKYKHHEQRPTPTTQAVMFCLMDVSGSMDEQMKNNAKLFYMLLHRFLKRNYERVDIVFVRHTTVAKEVDEEEFFFSRETGGTIVSTVLEKMQEIVNDRYPPNEWNIYGAQASDGDNWHDDNDNCIRLLRALMPQIQAYFYTEVTARDNSDLWADYEAFAMTHKDQFFMGRIKDKRDIFPVFREFFQKREGYEATPSSMTSSLAYQPVLP